MTELERIDCIGQYNKLIVTISSWPKRINNVPTVLDTIFENTMQPDLVILNLAKPDFNIYDYSLCNITNDVELENIIKKFNADLLIPIIDIFKKYNNFMIHFYDDSELRSWKKHLYAIDYANYNDVIICIDDDVLYGEKFIETLVKSYNYYGREFAITPITLNLCQGTYGFYGCGTLYKAGFLKKYYKYVNSTVLHMVPEDNYLLAIMNVEGHMPLPVIGSYKLYKQTSFNETDSNFGNYEFGETWWERYTNIMNECTKVLSEKCADKLPMQYGFSPNYFNFSYDNVKNYIEKYKDIHTDGPAKYVYDSLKDYFEHRFGKNGDESNTNIADKINVDIF